MGDDAVVQHLLAQSHLPGVGAAVHVNHPRHDGDTPLHDHDFLELALVTEGHAVHRTVRGERQVGPGDLLVIQPGQWHAYERCRGLGLWNCCIGAAVLGRELGWAAGDPLLGQLLPVHRSGQDVRVVHLDPEATAACAADLERVRALLLSREALTAGPEVVARVLLVLARAGRALGAAGALAPAPHPAIERAVQAMDARLDHAWGLPELCRQTGLTRFHLVRLFRRQLGSPPMAWLNRRRVEHAAVLLLTTDLAMAEVAKRVGWADANYFSRRFRAAFATSPRVYRAQLPLPALKPAADWVQW